MANLSLPVMVHLSGRSYSGRRASLYASIASFNALVVSSLESKVVQFETGKVAREDYDAICVLGGGYNADGTLPPWVHRRLEVTHKLFNQQTANCNILCVGGGTPHKPPVLDAEGFVIHESTMLARHLVQRGVDPYRILKESASYDTVGNAYFTLTTHTIPAKWKRMAIVTSNFHMPRAKTLFTDIFSLAADDISSQILLEFFGASDSSVLSPKTLAARQEREALSLKQWKEKSKELKTLEAFHKWLHETHQCYAVQRQHEFSHSNLNTHDAESY